MTRRPSRPTPDQPAGADRVMGQLPTVEAVRRFVSESSGRVGKREVARAFGLGPEHRAALRDLLREMGAAGEIAPAGAKRFRAPGRLAEEMVVQVTGTDPEGDAIARPVGWEGAGATPLVLMHPQGRGQPALVPGERVLARLRRIGPGRYEGRMVKRLSDAPGQILGVFRPVPEPGDSRAPRRPEAGRLVPTDRRQKAEWSIPPGETMDAEPDEIVLAEPLPSLGYGLKPARVVEKLGRMGDARSVSLICIHTYDIPAEFPAAALAEAEAAGPVDLSGRTDLRHVPLVTIDGEDARDFDDAVFAEANDSGGWRLLVAIADVAHYVRAGSALDREAFKRGNSVYFPDRVVPMLPEALSNGWCSLRPGENRGCLFAELVIDSIGNLLSHRFGRGLMRSAARLTYAQLQQARDTGTPVENVPEDLPAALYGAYRTLLDARARRGTLDLDLPERLVTLGEAGRVTSIVPRPRLDSHRLIEEFMVLANVAAAAELRQRRQPCMFRIHAPPSPEKLEALRDFLSTLDSGLGLSIKPAGELRPADLDAILQRVAGTDLAPQVNEMMLRSQSQAEYSPDNIGHFGLALREYAHFTSPIRRYADLLVHRALIGGLRLGPDGIRPEDAAAFEEWGAHITTTERRAALAEREAVERYIAAHMADKIGCSFSARISGVTRFGLFVTLTESGASGLVPVSTLPDDFWMHDETAQALTGRRSGISFRLAQTVDVRLTEAAPVTGGLLFAIEPPSTPPSRRAGAARRGGSARRP
jgi:ribonuclease R